MVSNLTEIILILALVLVIIIVVIVVIWKVTHSVRQSFHSVKQVANQFMDMVEDQQIEEQVRPKSLSTATSLYLPQIEKDFPEFNYFEFKNITNNTLISTFLVLDTQDLSKLVQCSDRFKETISLEINSHKNSNTTPHYEQVTIHQTEISNYVKKEGRCIITLQSAVGYCHWIEKDGEVIKGNKSVKKQTRYYMDLVYVQNQDIAMAHGESHIGNNCPNCGGQIATIGEKCCSYCGCALQEINIKVWSLDGYREVN